MFSYFGSKSKICHLYPAPQYESIIEPFAGSARYSLLYWKKDITIIDNNVTVIGVWKYLQNASYGDIMSLPKKPQDINVLNLSQAEKDFLGFCWARGNAFPAKKVGLYSDGWESKQKSIASDIKKIQHWNIIFGSYSQIENKPATWFIDAPYQYAGNKYKNHKISYGALRKFCLSREGQIIVCENEKADWLSFEPLCSIQGARNNNPKEYVYTNTPTMRLL